jgi:hypothetical protein
MRMSVLMITTTVRGQAQIALLLAVSAAGVVIFLNHFYETNNARYGTTVIVTNTYVTSPQNYLFITFIFNRLFDLKSFKPSEKRVKNTNTNHATRHDEKFL